MKMPTLNKADARSNDETWFRFQINNIATIDTTGKIREIILTL